ncbi:hypothetical protein I4300191C4_13230 [Solibaculum mannosilyticum]|nr:hypothetical protein BN3661_02001 [Eubacteriaceae bacterium CHKCI005]
MKLGRKMVAFLLVLTLVVAFCGFMASAANGYGSATARYDTAKQVTARITACSCKPRSNSLSVYILYTVKGQSYVSSASSGTYTPGQAKTVSAADPISCALGHFNASCHTCGRKTFDIKA